MTTHDLKVWPEFFTDLADGAKLFELRRNDRPFEEGDWLRLREYQPHDFKTGTPAAYTGQRCLRQIAYILKGEDTAKLMGRGDNDVQPVSDDWVVLGLAPPIMPLMVQLQGHRIFVEGVDKKVAVELSEYLAELAGFVERTKQEVHDAKGKKP